MNAILQLIAAILFVLWDRCRMLRGAWRRGEWRNVGWHALWIGAFTAVVICTLALPLWALSTFV